MLGTNHTISFIASTDLKRSRDFYEAMLGLRFLKDDGFAAVFLAGERMVRIANVSQIPDFKPFPFTVLGWEVSNVSEKASLLHERGIRFERYSWMEQDEVGVWTAPNGDKVAWFKDPDGNVLSLSSHR